jgi:hypothetical protein
MGDHVLTLGANYKAILSSLIGFLNCYAYHVISSDSYVDFFKRY